jgi:hypothetical protein
VENKGMGRKKIRKCKPFPVHPYGLPLKLLLIETNTRSWQNRSES